MDVREKLVEILKQAPFEGKVLDEWWWEEKIARIADHLIAHGVTAQDNTEISDELLKQLRNASLTVLHEEPTIELVQEWISVDERIPQNFVSVLGYMTVAGEFPPVRECYTVGNEFFFPALGDVHPVSHWMPLPQSPKGE